MCKRLLKLPIVLEVTMSVDNTFETSSTKDSLGEMDQSQERDDDDQTETNESLDDLRIEIPIYNDLELKILPSAINPGPTDEWNLSRQDSCSHFLLTVFWVFPKILDYL